MTGPGGLDVETRVRRSRNLRTIGVLAITLPAWVLWRNRTPRPSEVQSSSDKPTLAVENPEPAEPDQASSPQPDDEDHEA